MQSCCLVRGGSNSRVLLSRAQTSSALRHLTNVRQRRTCLFCSFTIFEECRLILPCGLLARTNIPSQASPTSSNMLTRSRTCLRNFSFRRVTVPSQNDEKKSMLSSSQPQRKTLRPCASTSHPENLLPKSSLSDEGKPGRGRKPRRPARTSSIEGCLGALEGYRKQKIREPSGQTRLGDEEEISLHELREQFIHKLCEISKWDPKEANRVVGTLNRASLMRMIEVLGESKLPIAPTSREASTAQLRILALSSCIPFIGFGFVDNFIMIVAGDFFDTSLCVLFGFSTMAAAALGNLISDLMGIGLGGYIERVTHLIGFAQPDMTKEQMESGRARLWYHGGCAVGIAIGCVLGMLPLLFIDTRAAERLKQKKQQEELFGIAMEDVARYVQAEKAVLYLLLNSHNQPDYVDNLESLKEMTDNSQSFHLPSTPNSGTTAAPHFYIPHECPLTGRTIGNTAEKEFLTTVEGAERRIPIGDGIPGQVYKTGRLINWRPTHNEATRSAMPKSFTQETTTTKFPTTEPEVFEGVARQILGIPVFGVTGEIIGVVEVINPLNKEFFTKRDKEFLLSISSHLAIEIEGKQHITNVLKMCRQQILTKFKAEDTRGVLTRSDRPSLLLP